MQRELDQFIAKNKEKKAKPTKMAQAIKAKLQKALLDQRIKFKEEQKRA